MPDEDAMQYLVDDKLMDVEPTDNYSDPVHKYILWEEAIAAPELPRISGKFGRIFELAAMGKSAQEIADDMHLTRRQINNILRDNHGTLQGKIESAARQLELPL
ncbi:MAG: hypothetical protein ACYCXX_05095 [Acidiferrobacter thiooxydans]